jgi:hypothetical protein
MSGAIPPPSNTSSWRGAQLKAQGLYLYIYLENRVLRRIPGTQTGDVAGSWRRLHSEELHSFYASSNVIRTIKSRRMR